MSSSVHVDDKKKDILIFGKDLSQEQDDALLTPENEHSLNFSEQHKKNCLSFHYNRMNSHLFVNIVKIYKSEAKGSVINAASLYLRNVSKYSLFNNMKRLAFMDMFQILVDFDVIAADEILDIYKYSMKNDGIKKTFGFIKKMFIVAIGFIILNGHNVVNAMKCLNK